MSSDPVLRSKLLEMARTSPESVNVRDRAVLREIARDPVLSELLHDQLRAGLRVDDNAAYAAIRSDLLAGEKVSLHEGRRRAVAARLEGVAATAPPEGETAP